jgi:lysosomal Pro-X carboxypeptidase
MRLLLFFLPCLLISGLEVRQDALAGYDVYNFTSFVDNYGYTGETFPMRYFVNTQFQSDDGPILFYCGNEGAIEMFIESSGFLPVLAQELNAVLVFAEHRYFGESLPFGSQSFSSPQNMKYLSPHQALADYAYLLLYLLEEYNYPPVIVTGGSYGGMLAAWFRMKYPHFVDIAYAASAPIYHLPGTVDPEEYNQIISDDYANINQQCYDTIQYGFNRLQVLVEDSLTFYNLSMTFQTCEDVNTTSTAQYIIEWLYNAYEYMAMTDYPYSTNFLSPMPAWPVEASCSFIAPVNQSNTDWEVLTAMKNSANIYYNYSGGLICNEIIQDYDNDLGQTGWDYLACSTLVLPIGADGQNDMFVPNPWDYSTYAQNCLLKWSRSPQPLYGQTFFGASDPAMGFSSLIYESQFIFTNGKLDPWQSGAVIETPNPYIWVFNIEGGAHHLDMRAPNPQDPQDVTDVRTAIAAVLANWLN